MRGGNSDLDLGRQDFENLQSLNLFRDQWRLETQSGRCGFTASKKSKPCHSCCEASHVRTVGHADQARASLGKSDDAFSSEWIRATGDGSERRTQKIGVR